MDGPKGCVNFAAKILSQTFFNCSKLFFAQSLQSLVDFLTIQFFRYPLSSKDILSPNAPKTVSAFRIWINFYKKENKNILKKINLM